MQAIILDDYQYHLAQQLEVSVTVYDYNDRSIAYAVRCNVKNAKKIEGTFVVPFIRPKDQTQILFVKAYKNGEDIIQEDGSVGMSIYHYMGYELYQYSPGQNGMFDVTEFNMMSRKQKSSYVFRNKAQ